MAYGQIIIDLAQKHPDLHWRTYDSLFRQQLNAGGPFGWNELNPSLMAAAVLGSQRAGEGCHVRSLCMAADHLSSERVLSSLELNLKAPTYPLGPIRAAVYCKSQTIPYSPPKAYSGEPCRRFNHSTCSIHPCKYDHICNDCFKEGHCALDCRIRNTRLPPLPASPEPGLQSKATLQATRNLSPHDVSLQQVIAEWVIQHFFPSNMYHQSNSFNHIS